MLYASLVATPTAQQVWLFYKIVTIIKTKMGLRQKKQIWKLLSPQTPVGLFKIGAGNLDTRQSNAPYPQMLSRLSGSEHKPTTKTRKKKSVS